MKPKVKPVKLICGITYNRSVDLNSIDSLLILYFGPIENKTRIFDFDYSDYYKDEMGIELKKVFYSFEELIQPDSLADIKNKTISIESEYATDNKRNFNLDPGYIEESKLVLASTKNFSHRIYLKDNIWAEVTLTYTNNQFKTHPWTYPDYATELASEFFKKVREIYRKQIG
jgi:hypothetical protein